MTIAVVLSDLPTAAQGQSILSRESDKVALDSPHRVSGVIKINLKYCRLPAAHSLKSHLNAADERMMLNAPAHAQHYNPALQGVRRHHRLRSRFNLYARDQMRRLADVLIACVLLVLTAPLLLLVAAALKLESPGRPVLRQRSCIGHGGRRFHILSFRTIADDPEGAMPLWLRGPTPLGQFLRFTRIEALPQLINVLRGEMSMIDPQRRSPSFLD